MPAGITAVDPESAMPATYRLLSVLMPIFNESRTLRTIIARVLSAPSPLPIELICVDDASGDDTWRILQELAAQDSRIRVFQHQANQGKAATIRTAIAHMTGDIALIQDADLEYDPRDYAALLAPLLEGKADAVFGSRFVFSGQRRVLRFWHATANRVLTDITNMMLDLNLTDMETCYKAIRADIFRQLPLKAERFGIEPEITARLAQWNIRIYEVPISYHGRTVAEGKKIGLKDAFEAIWTLAKCCWWDHRFTTHDGYYLLANLRKRKKINRWILSQFERYIGARVLETGCGIGNFAEQLLHKPRLVCIDTDAFYAEMTSRRFGQLENVRVIQGELLAPEDLQILAAERLDSIICHNVLEHLPDDQTALPALAKILAPGGYLVALAPAHQRLMSRFDEKLGHLRRYDPDRLRNLLSAAGLEVVSIKDFNRLGALGWCLNGILGRYSISPGQLGWFQHLLPVARLMETTRIGPGLSLVAIGRKPLGSPADITTEATPH